MSPFVIQGHSEKFIFHKPIVMGILNLTPDSFYDGGKHQNTYIEQVEKMVVEGAAIIDIGAMSSRPGSIVIDAQQEIERLQIPVKEICKKFPKLLLSIDTIHSETAAFCLEEGFSIVNDISAAEHDADMLRVLKKYSCTYVAMHMRGTPSIMQTMTNYENVSEDIHQYFETKLELLSKHGVEHVVLDPGFGFAKTIEQNFGLLRDLSIFSDLAKPLLVGVSRKGMIYKTLGIGAEDALNGSTALHMFALQQGANILRVHDVKEAVECISLFEKLID